MKVTEIIMSNSIQESTIGDAWRVLRGTAKVAEPEVAQAAKTARGIPSRSKPPLRGGCLPRPPEISISNKTRFI